MLLEVPDIDTGPTTFRILDDVVLKPLPLDEVPLIVKLLPPVLVIVVVPEPKITPAPV